MTPRILRYRCRRALKALDRADAQLTSLWMEAKNSDRAEIRDLASVLSDAVTDEQKSAVLEAQEIIRNVYERDQR